MLSCVNRFAVVALLVTAGLTLSSAPVTAQTPRLEVSLSNDYVDPGVSTGWLTAYIRNPIDSVAGFKIWMQLDRPDVIAFVPTTPSPHLDFDSTGSVIGGWEFLDVRSLADSRFDAQVVAIADMPGLPQQPGIGPSSQLRQLFRIPFVVLPGTDTMADPLVHVMINYDFPGAFDFSTPAGMTIPWADSIGGQAVIDTMKIKVRAGSVYVMPATCAATSDLNGDGMTLTVADMIYMVRLLTGQVDAPDSLYRVDFNGDCVVDSADRTIFECYLVNGLSCLPFPFPHPTCCNPALKICCQGSTGNVDCDPGDIVDISDLTALIDYLYLTFAPLCCFGEANIDGDVARTVDISDLTALIDRLYLTFTLPAPCF